MAVKTRTALYGQVPLTLSPLGHGQAIIGAVVQNLPAIPVFENSRVIRAVILPKGEAIVFSDDGDEPDPATDLEIPADSIFVYDGDVYRFRLRTTATAVGTADLRVAYYGD